MCTTASSLVLLICSTLFLAFGSAYVGIGTWFQVDKDRVINMFRISDNEKHFEVLESPSLLEYAILIMLTYGICLYFVAIIGCAATFTTKVSTCFSAYVTAMTVAVILQVTAIIVVALYNIKFDKNAEKYWTATLNEKYIGPFNREDTATKAWDSAQAWIGCCGVHGQSDFKNQKGWDRKWINQETKRNRQAKIPATCCMFKSSAPDIMGMRTEQQFLKYLIRPDCPVSRRQSHHEGCYLKLHDTFQICFQLFIAFGVVNLVLQIIAFVAAFIILARK